MANSPTTNGAKAQAILNNRAPKPPSAPPKKKIERSDFEVRVDDDTGSLCISANRGYYFQKDIILTIDELPERYQAFFANYLLCK